MIWPGQGLHVTTLPEVHHALLAAAAPLDTDGASSADRKAYRIYADRLSTTPQSTLTNGGEHDTIEDMTASPRKQP